MTGLKTCVLSKGKRGLVDVDERAGGAGGSVGGGGNDHLLEWGIGSGISEWLERGRKRRGRRGFNHRSREGGPEFSCGIESGALAEDRARIDTQAIAADGGHRVLDHGRRIGNISAGVIEPGIDRGDKYFSSGEIARVGDFVV